MSDSDKTGIFLKDYTDTLRAKSHCRFYSLLQKLSEKRPLFIINKRIFSKQLQVGQAPSGGKIFIFYTPATVAYGKVEFRKTLGRQEKLEDNWRRAEKEIQGFLIQDQGHYYRHNTHCGTRKYFNPQNLHCPNSLQTLRC